MTPGCCCGGDREESRGVLTVRLISKGEPHIICFHNLKCWCCTKCGAVTWDGEALAKRMREFKAMLARRRYEERKRPEEASLNE